MVAKFLLFGIFTVLLHNLACYKQYSRFNLFYREVFSKFLQDLTLHSAFKGTVMQII